MLLRHLETLVAIDEEGSFTAAADALNTVQSNVSDQVRQLERDLGVPLLVRGRRGAEPTEFGVVVLERARRVQRELESMRADLSMIQGLEAGSSHLGVVGTASRWLVPALAIDLRQRAPGVLLRINEAASERLTAEVLAGELPQAIVTQPIVDRRLAVEHLIDEGLVVLIGPGMSLPPAPVSLASVAELPLVLPPPENPLRIEIEAVADSEGVALHVPLEVEGIRLIPDVVAAGTFASIIPESAVPPELDNLRSFAIAHMPPRRLAIVSTRDVQLSLADRAVRESVERLVERRLSPVAPPKEKKPREQRPAKRPRARAPRA